MTKAILALVYDGLTCEDEFSVILIPLSNIIEGETFNALIKPS